MKFYCFFHILLFLFCVIVYIVVYFVSYLILYIMYSFYHVYVFLLLCAFCSRYSVSLCCSLYCLCVNVYCTTATGCQTQLQLTNISNFKTKLHISCYVPTISIPRCVASRYSFLDRVENAVSLKLRLICRELRYVFSTGTLGDRSDIACGWYPLRSQRV
jgi:hypothetical protein